MRKSVGSFLLFMALSGAASLPASAIGPLSGTVMVSMGAGGSYVVSDSASGWLFKGSLPSAAEGLKSKQGSDALGSYQELDFRYQDPAGAVRGALRLYPSHGVVEFRQRLLVASHQAPLPFPDFRALPQGLYAFSFKPENFAPPVFSLPEVCTPWMLFDAKDQAVVLSPASNFNMASMWGDGKGRMASGLNAGVTRLPAGFTQCSLMALGQGINNTWEAWGQALTAHQGKIRPSNDADILLKVFGYWTDAGSAYWYNYDPLLGYAGTLRHLVDTYRQEGIPLGYMQLDSWWYHKSLSDPSGKPGGPRNARLPQGDWNRYGGLMDYHAHPFIFPQGLKAFTQSIGLPVANHNRWVDRASAYHRRFKISGIAAVDPRFWDEIAAYLHDGGSMDYEQDWLSEIYRHSPELATEPGLGDAFMDNLSAAFEKRGMSVQYCMALPLQFLQGSRYNNLTTIRVSDDGFKPDHYHNFLYASRLASALGIWPWCDVFMSHETDNLILAVLSGGPVGCGDFLGQEDKKNILRAARPDGVIVKPDAPLLPTDASYLAEAQGRDRPLVASTYTDHAGLRTIYGIAFRTADSQADSLAVDPAELGASGPVYFYDCLSGQGAVLASGKSFPVEFHKGSLAYFVLAPLSANGIALLGDADKLVGTGKKRISVLRNDGDSTLAEVLFAPGEGKLKLHGYATGQPKASAGGEVLPVAYDASSGFFSVDLSPDKALSGKDFGGDPVRILQVLISKR